MLAAMIGGRRIHWADALLAWLFWMLLGIALGCYNRFAWSAGGEWPLPPPEALGARLLAFFWPPVQGLWLTAALWVLAYPLAGLVWTLLLGVTAPYFGPKNEDLAGSASRLALASVPLWLPLPYLLYLAGGSGGSWQLGGVTAVLLGRAGAPTWPYVNWVYLALGIAALVWHIFAYARTFRLPFNAAWKHWAVCLVLYGLVLVGLSVVLGQVWVMAGARAGLV